MIVTDENHYINVKLYFEFFQTNFFHDLKFLKELKWSQNKLNYLFLKLATCSNFSFACSRQQSIIFFRQLLKLSSISNHLTFFWKMRKVQEQFLSFHSNNTFNHETDEKVRIGFIIHETWQWLRDVHKWRNMTVMVEISSWNKFI